MPKGIKFSEEHKKRISDSLKGRLVSEQSRQRMSLSKMGIPIFKARKRITLKCIVCKKDFEVKLSHKNKRKTCSSQCMAVLYQTRLKGKNNPNYKEGRSSWVKCGNKGLGNRLYKKGQDKERKARLILEKQGYYVMRSGGSKGIFDLCAIRGADIKLIQVKTNGSVTLREKNKIKGFTNYPVNAQKELWVFYDKRKLPEVTLL